MSKKIWNAEAFRDKNALRKSCRAKNAQSYVQGRITRKNLTSNGCFGTYEPKQYNEMAVGTSGYRD